MKQLDPCYMQIPGRFGTVYPDGQALRVDIDHHLKRATRLRKIPRCVLVQDGDFEKTFRFPVAAFEDVAQAGCENVAPEINAATALREAKRPRVNA